MAIVFGEFELDKGNRTLKRDGVRIRINAQAFDFLRILVESEGRLVTREELKQQLWAGSNVDLEHSLDVLMSRVRKILVDDSKHPRYIETITKQGYRFIEQVSVTPRLERKQPRVWLRTLASYVAIAVLAGIVSIVIVHNRYPDRAPAPKSSETSTSRYSR
jgi:DNA-binding winged helix-turn-helix (wHTH) protein